MARAAGFDNISLDLMMWLPQQTVAQWLESVDALIALGPDHASLYLLEIYPNAPLRDAMARAQWSVAPDDDAADMYLSGLDRLDSGRLRAVRDLERRAARARVAAQPEILDATGSGSASAAAPIRPGRRPLEEPVVDRGVHRGRVRRRTARRRSGGPLSAEERLEEALFTGLRLTAGARPRGRRSSDMAWMSGHDSADELQPFVDAGASDL